MYKNYFACKCDVTSRDLSKLFLAMKLLTILMFVCIFQVSANSYAQNVNLTVKNAPLKEVFQLLTDQTKYEFIYNSAMLQNANTVSIFVKDEPFLSVLKKCFKNQPVNFLIRDNTIIVTKVEEPLIVTLALQNMVVGSVVSADDGQPMPGVSIKIKGGTKAATTDNNGKFKIEANIGQTLLFSYLGFEGQEFVVKNNDAIKILLKATQNALSDVVVVGYGVQNRRDVTGSVSTVKAQDLNLTNAVSIDNLLQGKAAGLNITSNSAQPGGALNINIRGALSPLGDNNPLYVIDGLPITSNSSVDFNSNTGNFRGGINRSPLTTLNPNDIESIDVLKDASATSIYGSAAANGVILITTKKGKNGKVVVNYNGSYGVQSSKNYLQPLSEQQFRNAVDDIGQEYYRFNNKLAPYGNKNPSTVPAYSPFFTPDQLASAGKGTNYIDYILRQGSIIDQNVSVSGGNTTTKIFTSFNLYDQQGLIKNSNFKRYSGRINVDQKIGKPVTLSLGLTYSQVNNDNIAVGQSGDIESPSLIQAALQFAPDKPLFTTDGKPNTSYYARTANPASFFDITNKTFTKRLIATPKLQIDVMDGLKLNFTGGIDNSNSEREFFVPVKANFTTVTEGDAQRGFNKQNNYSAEGFANYDKSFKNSRFSGVVGVGFYNTSTDGFGLDSKGFSTDAFGVNNIGIAYDKLLSTVYSNRTERNKLSQFTRLNYTVMDKYILQVTGRFDGSSNFPTEKQFGFFPGISTGWIISEEDFLNKVNFISQLKLRGGYGTSGNESITTNGNYAYSLYSLTTNYSYLIGSQLYNSGFIQTQLGNPKLKWETDETINLGLDFGLFKNRISGTFEYFVRTAKDLLDFRILPSANAIGAQAFNVGSTRSKGIEFTLNTKNIVNSSFSWTSTLTMDKSKTYWLKRNPAVALASYIGKNDPINAVYGWKTNGLIRSESAIPPYQTGAFVGNIKYVDINNDNKLDINDVSYLGDYSPKGTFGLNNTLNFKGFDINFFIYGSYGAFSFDAYQNYTNTYNLLRTGAPVNAEIHSTDIYTSFNTNGTYPGLATDLATGNNPSGTNDFRTQKNSYFARLKNLTLGYSWPLDLINSQRLVRSARLFIDIQNLGYTTNIKGLDPEMDRNNNPYPTALTTSFGISAQF